MAQRFSTTAVCREFRFAIGVDTENSQAFLSIPCTNGMIDYDELYSLSPDEYAAGVSDLYSLRDLAERCRYRLEDGCLYYDPSLQRGKPT